MNVSSIGGRLTLPLSALYGGSKFAVEGISASLSYGMREIGVRVKLVEPGMIKTNFVNAMEFSNDGSLSEYQRLVGKLWEVAGSMAANGADAATAAAVIFTATTDATDQLRYSAGEDARHLAARRSSASKAPHQFSVGMRSA